MKLFVFQKNSLLIIVRHIYFLMKGNHNFSSCTKHLTAYSVTLSKQTLLEEMVSISHYSYKQRQRLCRK